VRTTLGVLWCLAGYLRCFTEPNPYVGPFFVRCSYGVWALRDIRSAPLCSPFKLQECQQWKRLKLLGGLPLNAPCGGLKSENAPLIMPLLGSREREGEEALFIAAVAILMPGPSALLAPFHAPSLIELAHWLGKGSLNKASTAPHRTAPRCFPMCHEYESPPKPRCAWRFAAATLVADAPAFSLSKVSPSTVARRHVI